MELEANLYSNLILVEHRIHGIKWNNMLIYLMLKTSSQYVKKFANQDNLLVN